MENLFTLDCPTCTTRQTELVLSCSSCGELLHNIEHCHPFQLLGLPVSLFIDFNDIRAAYLQAQKNLHPDLFITQPTLFPFATQVSSLVNKAFAQLQCPFQSAQAFLQAHGIHDDVQEVVLDPQTLQHLLTLQEQACSTDMHEKNAILVETKKEIQRLRTLIEKAVQQQLPEQARSATAQMSFLIRIQKNAKKISRTTHS